MKTLFDDTIYESELWKWKLEDGVIYRTTRRFVRPWWPFSGGSSVFSEWIRSGYIKEVPSEDAV